MRVIRKMPLLGVFYDGFISYPTPSNITYFWNFGIYATVCLVVQILTGVALAMHFVAEVNLAFFSVEHIMRDINYGWLLRYLHANGASMFFVVVYIHTFRGMYYSSYVYPKEFLWVVGVLILLLMIITAFLGYVLPWGQMSFWAATVITNFVTAVPYLGNDIVVWLWGGFSVDNATLNRFYSLHYLMPFIIVGLVLVHFVFLHEHGSNNPLGVHFNVDVITMYPYYILKDLYGLLLFLCIFSVFVFFMPNFLGHPDNYIAANPLVTPAHIVPEWYFLPFYGILRSVPSKLGGVVALIASIVALVVLPFICVVDLRSSDFRPVMKFVFWLFVVVCVILGWIGSKPAAYPYVIIGQVFTFLYFFIVLVLLPLIGRLEKLLWDENEIKK